jgi:NitT/TauT family transport system permease protein
VTQDPGRSLVTDFFLGFHFIGVKVQFFVLFLVSSFIIFCFLFIKKIFCFLFIKRLIMATWQLATQNVLFEHLKSSLFVLLSGVAAAVIFGVSFGILIHLFRSFRRPAVLVVDAVRSVAAIALFPVFILLFGIGFMCKSAVIFWTAWPPVLLSTVDSLDRVDANCIDAAENMGAGAFSTLLHVSLPIALPGILTGIRTGAGTGWISLIAAEMLGSNSGLGFFVLLSSQTFDYAGMFTGIVLIAVTGLAVNQLLLKIQGACEL